MKFRYPPGGALCVSLLLLLQSRSALGDDAPVCPSPADQMYKVKRDETLSDIATRFYCVKDYPPITHVWQKLYDYNRTAAGPEPQAVPIDTILCLPRQFSGTGWRADRCVVPEPSTPLITATGCGNGHQEGTEVCDGPDLATMTCAKLGLGSGELACRADCSGFDPTGCGQEGSARGPSVGGERSADETVPVHGDGADRTWVPGGRDRDKRDRAPKGAKKRLLEDITVDLTAGVAVPFSGAVRDHLYRVLAVTGLGARATLGWVEVSARGVFVGGQHETLYYKGEEQQVLGGGLSAQVGVPFRVGPLRLTPGVELGWLYLHRRIELTDYPHAGEVEELSVHLPLVGVFVRPVYTIPSYPRCSVGLEIGSDLLPVKLGKDAQDITNNFNAKVLGGLGYAF